MPFPRPARVLALAFITTLLAAAGADAATFLPPKSIGAPSGFGDDSYENVDTASDGDGNSVVVYDRVNCASGGCVITAHYLRGSAGGGYSTPDDLGSPTGRDVAMNGAGHAAIVYGGGTTVRALVSAPGGNFGTPATLSSAGGSNPHVGIADNGTVVATWERDGVVRAAVKAPGAGAFGSGVQVSEDGESVVDSQLAVDGQGNATVAWLNDDGLVRAATKAVSGGFGSRQTVFDSDLGLANLHVAAAANRRATVVWTRSTGALEAAASDTTGTFGEPEQVSPNGAVAVSGDVAVDPSNRAVAIWLDNQGVLRAAVRGPGGGFGAPDEIASGVSPLWGPTVSGDRDGNALALWTNPVPGSAVVVAARRPAGGTFDDAETLSATGELALGAAAAFDADGNGHVVYTGRESGVWSVREIGLDVTGPRLRSLSVPTAGTAGESLEFSVDPFDRWSGATTSWDFGDGGQAAGEAVTHSFAQPGAYVVTVAAEDALGQRTTATRIINVAARQTDGGGTGSGTDRGGAGGGGTGGSGGSTGGGLQVVSSTVAHGWTAFRRHTIARRLAAINLPAGATVTVTCKAKKRKHCPKTTRVTTTFPRARLNLLKPFRKRKLPVGTKVIVAITAPGAIGKVVTFKVRRRAVPAVKIQCRPPGGRAGACV